MSKTISIITVTKDDDWALSKTLKSIFQQDINLFELVLVDGLSNDNTSSLAQYWLDAGLIDQYICEKDAGVYDAMNKGVKASNCEYVVFMNAGDTFYDEGVLARVAGLLGSDSSTGLLGWGLLNQQIWASWIMSKGFAIASLGFCHQALYLRREALLKEPFDARSFKTDSDTLQLSRVAENEHIKLLPEILAVRGGDAGISADLERTKASIVDTIVNEYTAINERHANAIVEFRRGCTRGEEILQLLSVASGEFRSHLAMLVLDTLFQWPSKSLDNERIQHLMSYAAGVLYSDMKEEGEAALENLCRVQEKRTKLVSEIKNNKKSKLLETNKLSDEITEKFPPIRSCQDGKNYYISLTSFPKRIDSLHLVIESLLRQTVIPERIYLTLGKDEIRNENWLPGKLRNLKQHGLIINFVEKTRHQYDKYLHTYSLNQDMPMVIVDDDVIYPVKSMEYLLDKANKNPELVVANRAHEITLNSSGDIQGYKEWNQEVCLEEPSHLIFPTGAGGVLYPRGFFDKDLVCNEGLILKYAPYADDVWLKGCSISKGIKSVCSDMLKFEPWYFRYTPLMTEGALHKTNVDKGTNDYQLRATLNHLAPGFTSKISMWQM